MNKKSGYRQEKDSTGEVNIPVDAYWGASTQRAREASVSAPQYQEQFLESLLLVKKAAALANGETGRLEPSVSRAIAQCIDEILDGQWRNQFITDSYLSGCTALHNNINEVVANRTAQTLGRQIGTYDLIHPQQHVNIGQSNADVYPTAVRLAILISFRNLEPLLLDLERLLRRKSLEFERIVKVGRINLRDSLPITLGQEFNAYGLSIERSMRRLKEASQSLTELNIGATQVGTGLDAEPEYVQCVVEKLSAFTGLSLRQADDFFRISQSLSDFVEFSSALKELALELIKILNDLRLLSSGPAGGFAEIKVPSNISSEATHMSEHLHHHCESSLNEVLIMASFEVVASDFAISLCAQSGQLEGNANMPLVADSLLKSLEILKNTLSVFNPKYLAGVTADPSRCRKILLSSESVVLALSPHLGEKQALQILNESIQLGKTVEELVLEKKLMTKESFEKSIYLKPLTRQGKIHSTQITPPNTVTHT